MSWSPRTDLYGDLLFSRMLTRYGTSRFRGQGLVGLAVSHDARFVASGTVDGTVMVWKASTGKLLFKAQRAGSIHAVAFAPGDARLATAGSDGVVRIWDLALGKPVRTLDGHADEVFALAWSPDGCWLTSGGGGRGAGERDRWVRVWDLAQGVCAQLLKGSRGDVRALAFSADSARLAVAGGTVVGVYERATGVQQVEHEDANDCVWGVAFDASGAVVAAVGERDPALLRWQQGVTRWPLQAGACCLALHGHRAAVGCDDGLVRQVDLASGEITNLPAHTTAVVALAWASGGTVLVSLARGAHTPRLWDVAGPRRITKGDGHDGPVRALACSAAGDRVFTAGADDLVVRWEGGGRFKGTIMVADPHHVAPASWQGSGLVRARSPDQLATSSSGQVLVASYGADLVVLEAPFLVDVPLVRGGCRQTITALAVSPSGALAVFGSADQLCVVRLADGVVLSDTPLQGPAVAIAFSGPTVLVACNGRQVCRWRLEDGSFVDAIEAAVSFDARPTVLSADGTLGAVAAATGLKVWDTESGELLHEIDELSPVRALAFSADRKRLAWGYGEGGLAAITLGSAEVQHIGAHDEGVNDLLWLADGRLLSCSDDATAVAWDAGAR